MKQLLLPFLFLPFFADAAEDSAMLKKIREEVLMHGACYENLRVLTKTIGHRLSASPQAAKAVQWGLKAMKAAGADTAWLQPVWVPHWERGAEWMKVKMPGSKSFEPMHMLSLGNSRGDGKVVEAPVIMVQTLDEFNSLPPEQVKGKIVFFNYRFRQDFVNTFAAYGDAIKYRAFPPTYVALKGGAGTIIRSLSSGLDDAPHTGMTRIVDTIRKIPSVAIGNTSADRLEAACKKGTVTAQLMTSGRMMDSVLSYNVIGELRGTTHRDEYIVVGGHLDSWDVGEGAQDDGAGCVQSIEVIRTLKALDVHPARTIRAVLFMNEENGARGGRAYADSARSRNEHHILAIESDAGGFVPRGIGMDMRPEKKAVVKSWSPLFAPMNACDFDREEGGTDIDPLGLLGVPLAGLYPDSQRYFDVHHTHQDVFESVNHRELKLGAAVLASLVYLASEHGL
jgi:hypothetical protein